MADAVTSQTLHDGKRNAVMKFTNISDGTGESAVTKVDVSALSGAPAAVRIDRIDYDTAGMDVDLLFDATADDLAWSIGADQSSSKCWHTVGGLQNPKSTGWTGDIKLTTTGAASGDRYSLTLHMVKKY